MLCARGTQVNGILLGALLLPVLLCPFSKVEESYGMNALYDLHEHGLDVQSYDHIFFPGVVPRTFVGVLYVYLISGPQRMLASNGWHHLIIVRVTMALVSFFVLRRLSQAVDRRCEGSALVFAVLIATQFHLPFYLSRSLGNTFGCWCIAMSIAGWIDRNQNNGYRRAIMWLVLASIVFRFETLIILGAACAYLIFTHRVSLLSLTWWIGLSMAASLLLTCTVDTFFWSPSAYSSLNGVHWPEMSVFWFNGVENQSSKWGVLPFHWYLTSALPKALGPQLFAIPFDIALLPFTAPIAVLSLLGHKELRFIFPSILAFTAFSSMNIARRFTRIYWVVLFAGAPLAASRLLCSYFNYPGGHALVYPNSPYPFGIKIPFIDAPEPPPHEPIVWSDHVHLDTFTTTVGVSHFLHPICLVSKEGSPGNATWALSERSAIPGFRLVSWQLGFSHLRWPPAVVLTPQVYILKRLSGVNTTSVNFEKAQ